MAKTSKDYKKGYEAAIEAIKKHLKGQSGGENSSSSGSQNDSGLEPIPGSAGAGQGGQNNQQQSGRGGQSGSRTDSSDSNQGVVRAGDCKGPDSLSKIPGNAGGMIDRETGDKIAKDEGYDDAGPSDKALENEWKDAAIKAASQMRGKIAGALKSKIEGLYKTAKDWKKELKKVVGYSISPDDKRSAYANKNVLVSQDRIARTDKDKYENMDYMMAFIDSSCSMSDDQLKLCLSVVYEVALAKKPLKLVVIQCDTKIQDIQEYTSLQQLKKALVHAEVKGRGGTELKPCWDLLVNDDKYKKRPAELVMVFTDGELTQYKRNPRTMKHLCWVILDNSSFQLKYKETNTKCVYLNASDIK